MGSSRASKYSTLYGNNDAGYVTEYGGYLQSLGAYYEEDIKNEKKMIYEVAHLVPELGLQLTTGLSAARQFLPAVKLSILPYIGLAGASISFDEMDWGDLISNIEKKPSNGQSNTIELANFTLTVIPCEETQMIKIENFEGSVYLCRNLVQKILFFNDLISKRISVLKSNEFNLFYDKTLRYVTKNFVQNHMDHLIQLSSINKHENSYCMLDFISFNSVRVINDIRHYLEPY